MGKSPNGVVHSIAAWAQEGTASMFTMEEQKGQAHMDEAGLIKMALHCPDYSLAGPTRTLLQITTEGSRKRKFIIKRDPGSPTTRKYMTVLLLLQKVVVPCFCI